MGPLKAGTGRVVVCGLEGLGLRTVEELRRLDVPVTVIAPQVPEARLVWARDLGVEVVVGDCRDEGVLRQAGVESATAVVLTDETDVGNIHAALVATELNPSIRAVIRAYNQELGAHLEPALVNGRLMSASAIAAPVFVAAALDEAPQHRISVAGVRLTVRKATPTDPSVALPLLATGPDGNDLLFPDGGSEAVCLTRVDEPGVAGAAGSDVTPRPFRARSLSLDRRLALLAMVLVAIVAVSVAVFDQFAHLSPIDALYFAVTVITTTGFGDINLRDAPAALKLYAVLLMVAGAATLALFYAVIADIVVGARLTRALGGIPRGIAGHVVVCGLGSVGYRIARQLAELGVPVVGVERHDGGPFVAAARREGIPVLVADAGLRGTLASAQITRARCLIGATDEDIANLVSALNARAMAPGIRLVLRLFDPDFAVRAASLGIHASYSVSALAAPAFAAAALGRRVETTIAVGRRTIAVALARVHERAAARGRTVAQLETGIQARLLVFEEGRMAGRPLPDRRLEPGDELIIVGTGPGVTSLLGATEDPVTIAASEPRPAAVSSVP